MRAVATGLLLAMATLYLVSRLLIDSYPLFGWTRAFAEAAMVGGLADWFAVTALFRRPMGLPIPHTAIIPENKDRIGSALAQFVRDNFLTPSVVARRMRQADIATAVGGFLARPAAAGRMRQGASRLFASVFEGLDQERLGGMVRSLVAERLDRLDIAPLVGRGLQAAIAEDRHVPLLSGIIIWAGRTLDANEQLIRDMIHERANALLRLTGLDETIANAILKGLQKMLADMAADPHHQLRAKGEEALAQLAHDLQHDPATRAKAEAFKQSILANPAISQWIDSIWEQGRRALLAAAHDPDAAVAGRMGDMLRQLGLAIGSNGSLKSAINRFARRAVVGLAASYGDGIVRLISDTVAGWDARTVSGRIEQAVGRDLQFIRINGTLVGGLVGLALHAIDRLL
jgi:uncharacterized membrane-anchored protein YjiN (DUF445 family)